MSGVVFLLAIAGAAGAVVYALQQRQEQSLAELRDRFGLEVVGTTPLRLTGVVAGRPVELRREDRGEQGATVVHIAVDFPLPPGFSMASATAADHLAERWLGRQDVQLGNELDDRLTLWGPRDDVRALLDLPAIAAQLRELLDDDVLLRFDDQGLQLHVRGVPIAVGVEAVQRALAFASALEDALARPWSELQRQLGLRDESDDRRRRLAGNVHGVPLIVQQHRPGRGDLVLRVTAQLTRPLPEATLLCHPDRGQGRSQPLGDPVLDRLHVLGATEALRERLCRDEVRAPLMELLHGNPGSVLTADRIGVLLYDATLDPRPWVDRVLELERALR